MSSTAFPAIRWTGRSRRDIIVLPSPWVDHGLDLFVEATGPRAVRGILTDGPIDVES